MHLLDNFFGSPRAQRRLFIISAGVLTVGVIAFLSLVVFRGTGNAFPDKFSNKPAQLAKPEKHVPITKAQLDLARKFLTTAVLRQNVDASYNIVHVDLRGRLTRKQWDTGNIPVISYPADNAKTAQFKIDYSYTDQALLEVELFAKAGADVRPSLLFFLGEKRAGAKHTGPWQISYWEPNWKPPIPAAPN